MAPTPASKTVRTVNMPLVKRGAYWTKPTIISTAVFVVLALGLIVGLVGFLLHRRSGRKRLAKAQLDRATLLQKEDKASMFSRPWDSQATLQLESEPEMEERNRSTSQEDIPHLPLDAISAHRLNNPMSQPTYWPSTTTTTTTSIGSGVSTLSRSTNSTSSRYTLSSPISLMVGGSDLGITVTTNRPRSTSSASRPRRSSTASRRYYDATSSNAQLPPVPRILPTASG